MAKVTKVDTSKLEIDVSNVLPKVQKCYTEILGIQREANTKLLPLYWDIGDHILKDIESSDKDSRRTIHKIAKEMDVNHSVFYICVKMAKTHTRKAIKTLGERGLTLGHLEATTAIEDDKRRREIEHKAADENWSVKQTRESSKEAKMIDGDGGEEKAHKEKKSKGSKDTLPKGNGPVATAVKFDNSLKEIMQYASDLVIMKDDLSGMGVDDAVKFSQAIDSARETFDDVKLTLDELPAVLDEMLASLKKK